MKQVVVLFILLSIGACSKNVTTSDKDSALTTAANYLLATENTDAAYNSSEVSIIQISEDNVVFAYGLANIYQQNPDGSPRAGNHPEAEFRMQLASYKIIKQDGELKLVFQNSSCKDSTKNPFESILPNSLSFTQLSDKLKIKFNAGEQTEYPLDVGNQGQDLLEANAVRVLCEGESND